MAEIKGKEYIPNYINGLRQVKPYTSDGCALGSASLMFSDLFLATGGVINWNNGDVTVTHSTNTLTFSGASSGYSFDANILLASATAISWNSGNVTLTHAAGKLTVAVAAPTTSIDCFTVGVTGGSATQGTVRGIVGSITTFGTALTSGTVTAVRGVVTLGASTNGVTYLYGAQGKFVGGAFTVASGSGHVCGVLAQMDLAGTTLTSGHVAPLIVSGQTLQSAANMIYCESGGNVINAVLESNVACNYFFSLNNFESCGVVATGAATAGSNIKKIKILVDGAVKYFICADNWS